VNAIGLLAASRPPQPFDAPGLEIFRPPCLVEWDVAGVNFCVDRGILYMFLAAGLVILAFVLAANRGGLIPRGIRNFVEWIVGFVRDEIAVQVIGNEGRPWVPFLTAMFCFILVGNIFGIIPGIQFPVNSRIALPAFMAALVWILFNAIGIRAQGLGGYLKSSLFPPGVPVGMYLLLTPIELVSTFILRPFTLAVRLLANMMAGHLILSIFFLGTAYLLAKPSTIPFAVPAFALSVALTGFEILVAVLQAYIFTILTAVYIAGAVHPDH
jgi:F-type H+-transporting ATPase subunit a